VSLSLTLQDLQSVVGNQRRGHECMHRIIVILGCLYTVIASAVL